MPRASAEHKTWLHAELSKTTCCLPGAPVNRKSHEQHVSIRSSKKELSIFPSRDASCRYQCVFYKYLQCCDYGFVHAVLSTERVHEDQWSSEVRSLGRSTLADLDHLLTYGPIYLTKKELEAEKARTLEQYYCDLRRSVLKMREKAFWSFDYSWFNQLGSRMSWRKIAKGGL
jgi:hypothetical protein